MAVQFHELPISVFPRECRPYIARLNRELRDLFGLEGSLRNPITTTRSDATVRRHNVATVDVTRITPSISSVTSGSSTVVGTPALTLGTSNTVGTTTTALATDSAIAVFGTQAPQDLGTAAVGTSAYAARGDHVHALKSSFHTGGYGTSATVGTSDSLIRADAILAYPEALGIVTDRTKSLTLTDDGSATALTVAGFGSYTNLRLKAQGASSPTSIGKWGNIGMAGSDPDNQTMLQFSKLDFSDASLCTVGIMSLTNKGAGGSRGMTLNIKSSGADAATSAANEVFDVTHQNTAVAASGDLIFARISQNNIGNTTRSAMAGMHWTAFSNSGTLTTMYGIRFNSWTGGTVPTSHGFSVGPMSGTSGAIVNAFNVDDIKYGLTRTGYYSGGFTTGTPTESDGFYSALHSVGTKRRSFRGENSFECGQNHMIVGTSGMGLIIKDKVDGNYYLITTASGVVGSSSIGTTLPAN